jgi:methyl-accepting chemotaxis protein
MYDEPVTATRHGRDTVLLLQSLQLLRPCADQLVRDFYKDLFQQHPRIRRMFPENVNPQHEKLFNALFGLAGAYAQPETLLPALRNMGRRHAQYGVQLADYHVFSTIFLAALGRTAGGAFTPEMRGAWERAFTFAAGAMMQAGAVAEVQDPASVVA